MKLNLWDSTSVWVRSVLIVSFHKEENLRNILETEDRRNQPEGGKIQSRKPFSILWPNPKWVPIQSMETGRGSLKQESREVSSLRIDGRHLLWYVASEAMSACGESSDEPWLDSPEEERRKFTASLGSDPWLWNIIPSGEDCSWLVTFCSWKQSNNALYHSHIDRWKSKGGRVTWAQSAPPVREGSKRRHRRKAPFSRPYFVRIHWRIISDGDVSAEWRDPAFVPKLWIVERNTRSELV